MYNLKYPITFIIGLFLLSACQKTTLDNTNTLPADSSQNGGNSSHDFGMMYFQNGDSVVQYDLNKEKEIRRFKTYEKGFGLYPFFGQVLSDSGKMYFSSVYSMTCMDALTGNVVWKQDLSSAGFQRSNVRDENYPVIVDSIIYNISYGGTGQSLNAFNKYSGKVLWRADIARNMELGGTYYGSPLVYKDKIYALCPKAFGYKQNIACFNRFTGEIIWERTDFRHNLEGQHLIANNSTLVVFSMFNSYVAGYNLENGNEEFFTQFATKYPFGTLMTVKNGKIYNYAGRILKVDLENRKTTVVNEEIDFWRFNFYNDFYVLGDSFRVSRRDYETFTDKWTWDTPYRDTLMKIGNARNPHADGYDYNISNYIYPFYVTDQYVFWFNAISRWKFNDDDSSIKQVLNSMFILDKETGKLIKEIKFPPNGYKNLTHPGLSYFSKPKERTSQYYP